MKFVLVYDSEGWWGASPTEEGARDSAWAQVCSTHRTGKGEPPWDHGDNLRDTPETIRAWADQLQAVDVVLTPGAEFAEREQVTALLELILNDPGAAEELQEELERANQAPGAALVRVAPHGVNQPACLECGSEQPAGGGWIAHADWCSQLTGPTINDEGGE